LVIIVREFLEAALIITFIRTVGTLGFSITLVDLRNTLSAGAGVLSLWITSTDFGVVVAIALEAAFFHHLIRVVRALGFAITESILWNAFTIGTSHFRLRVTSTSLRAVGRESLEAALKISSAKETHFKVFTFIRSVKTISLSVTEPVIVDTLTVCTRPFGIRVAATDFVIVEFVSFEAASFVIIIREI
jgi:hypothetical protein